MGVRIIIEPRTLDGLEFTLAGETAFVGIGGRARGPRGGGRSRALVIGDPLLPLNCDCGETVGVVLDSGAGSLDASTSELVDDEKDLRLSTVGRLGREPKVGGSGDGPFECHASLRGTGGTGGGGRRAAGVDWALHGVSGRSHGWEPPGGTPVSTNSRYWASSGSGRGGVGLLGEADAAACERGGGGGGGGGLEPLGPRWWLCRNGPDAAGCGRVVGASDRRSLGDVDRSPSKMLGDNVVDDALRVCRGGGGGGARRTVGDVGAGDNLWFRTASPSDCSRLRSMSEVSAR